MEVDNTGGAPGEGPPTGAPPGAKGGEGGRRLTMFPQDQAPGQPPGRKAKNGSFLLGTGQMPGGVMKAASKMRQSITRLREGSVSDTSGDALRQMSLLPMEPTYKMAPSEDKEFKSCTVRRHAYNVLERILEGMTYDQTSAPALSMAVSNAIRKEMKQVDMPRFKVICHVVIGEKKGQDLETVSRCVWNDSHDSYTSTSYQNHSLFAVATIFGVYHD